MGGFNGFHYLGNEQMNPVLSGLTMAFSVANQMKQQAMEQENMRMREAHQKRLDNADDMKNQMEMQRSGAKPITNGATTESMTTPSVPLPGAGGQNIMTIPGQTSQTQVPVDPSTVVNDRNAGRSYAMPTQMEQLQRTMDWKRAEGQASNENAMNLYKQKGEYDRPFKVEEEGRKTQAQLDLETAKAREKIAEDARKAADQDKRDARQNKATMDRTQYVQGEENNRNSARIGAENSRAAGSVPQIGTDGKLIVSPYARAIANYQFAPPSASRNPEKTKAIMAEVLAADPEYDATKFTARNKTQTDFAASGASGKALTATETALRHLNTISTAGQALKNGDVKALNAIANSLGAQVGGSAKTTYDTIISMVSPEISKAVIGTAGGQGEREAMQKNFSSSAADQQREGAIGSAAKLLGARMDTSRNAYKETMGKDLNRKLSPEAQGVLDKYSKPAGGAPKYNVGDSVTYNGAVHKIKAIKPDGKLVLEQ